jgi:hypothetical protein
VDPAVVVGIVAFVMVIVFWRVALRRAPTGDSRLAGILYLPALAGGLVVIWAGTRVIGSSLPVGLLIVAFGSVTTVLVARMILSRPGSVRQQESNGELSGPYFDYIIWVAIGLPVFLVLALAILAITGGLTPR